MGAIAQDGGMFGAASQAQDRDGQVAQAGHDARAVAGADPAAVFVEVDAADPDHQRSGLCRRPAPGNSTVKAALPVNGHELTLSDKEYNSQVSSFRAPVERLVGHFKNWKILHTDYRRPYSTYHDTFDAARSLFFFSITWGFE
jgi:DDE superfamily endonuclease